MRKTLMTMALVGLLALPVLAQFRPGGFGRGQAGGDALLSNKSVQAELKLDDKQKETLKEIGTKSRELSKEAMEAYKDGDKEKGKELMEKATTVRTAAMKKFKDGLTSIQAKRFAEIEVQVGMKTHDANLFKQETVQKALALTDKQKTTVKESLSDLEKDVKELMDDAKGDRNKFKEVFKKVGDLRKDTYEKITKALTEEQTKTLTSLGGEKFDYKPETGGRPGGGGRGKKDAKKEKKDDF